MLKTFSRHAFYTRLEILSKAAGDKKAKIVAVRC